MKNTMNNLNKKYHITTIAIHWLTTVLILILFPLGNYMSDININDKLGLIQIHVLLGLSVFVLTLIRTWVFFSKKKPEDIKTGSPLNDRLVVWVHKLFYIMLFGIAISGIASMVSGGYIDALQSGKAEFIVEEEGKALKAHGLLSALMMILLVVHIAGVIKHYIKTKENTLKRIIP